MHNKVTATVFAAKMSGKVVIKVWMTWDVVLTDQGSSLKLLLFTLILQCSTTSWSDSCSLCTRCG